MHIEDSATETTDHRSCAMKHPQYPIAASARYKRQREERSAAKLLQHIEHYCFCVYRKLRASPCAHSKPLFAESLCACLSRFRVTSHSRFVLFSVRLETEESIAIGGTSALISNIGGFLHLFAYRS